MPRYQDRFKWEQNPICISRKVLNDVLLKRICICSTNIFESDALHVLKIYHSRWTTSTRICHLSLETFMHCSSHSVGRFEFSRRHLSSDGFRQNERHREESPEREPGEGEEEVLEAEHRRVRHSVDETVLVVAAILLPRGAFTSHMTSTTVYFGLIWQVVNEVLLCDQRCDQGCD